MIVPREGHSEVQAFRRLLAVYLSMVMLAIGSAVYSHHVAVDKARAQFHMLCDVIVSTDNAYRQHPPVTDTGRQQAANFARLRAQCDDKGKRP